MIKLDKIKAAIKAHDKAVAKRDAIANTRSGDWYLEDRKVETATFNLSKALNKKTINSLIAVVEAAKAVFSEPIDPNALATLFEALKSLE